jgi:hypothetical protein
MLRKRQNRFLRLLLPGMVLALGLVGPSWANPTVTSSLWIPLEGDVQVGEDTVTLSGDIHVMTHVTIPRDPSAPVEVQWHVNVARGEGIGHLSGRTYRVVGGDWGIKLTPNDPNDPWEYYIYPVLDLWPLGKIVREKGHNWINIMLSLSFDSTWSLTEETRVVPCRYPCDRTP